MMSARRWLPFVAGLGVVGAVVLSGCGSAERQPLISAVRPSVIAPGGLMMISGRHLDRVVGVSVGGRPAGRFTPVNADLLTAEAPPDLADGSHTVELQALDGRRALTMVQVGSGRQPAASAPPVIQAPEPTPVPVVAAPTSAPTPAAQAAPSPSAGPFQFIVPARPVAVTPQPPRRDDDDKDDKKEDKDDERRPGGQGRGLGR